MESIKQCENEYVELITLIFLCTGARWREAEGLTSGNVRDGKVTFNDTKNGKNRTIPIADWLFELPKGQVAHVLRHSFASHFMINGGNILKLQRILGHSDIRITMRYAHLAPDHFNEAIRLNPFKDFT